MAATVVAIVGCEKTQDLGPAEVTVVSPAETTVNAPQEGTEFTVTLKATDRKSTRLNSSHRL